jgi:hypothetical protein
MLALAHDYGQMLPIRTLGQIAVDFGLAGDLSDAAGKN